MGEVLVLQHAEAEGLGSIADALAARGHRWRYVRAFAGEAVPARLDADGLVALGGPMSAYDTATHPFLAEEVRLLQSALEQDKPVLGICLGSQLLATALGSRVYRAREKEIGWYPVQLDLELQRDRLFAAAGQVFTPLHWHGDVFDLPAGTVPLGHSARTRHQGFRHGAATYGMLFHLEMTRPQIEAMLVELADELREAGVAPEVVKADTDAHFARAASLAAEVFGAWAGLVG